MNFKSIFAAVLSFFVSSSLPAKEKIKVVTTIPDFAWLAEEIGDSALEVNALLSGRDNPHYVDAIPEYVRKVANADVVCVVGMELEVGYMPAILSRSGNAAVQHGGKGYCDLGNAIDALEKHSEPIDRSMGDVHPHGNPHYYLSPMQMIKAGERLKDILISVAPANAKQFTVGYSELTTKLLALKDENAKRLKSIDRSKPLIIEYHKEFSYFLHDYGLKSFGSIEEKPGVPPSSRRLAEVALAARNAGVKVVLSTDYNPEKTLQKFSELSGLPVIRVPSMVQRGTKLDDYPKVHNHIVDQLIQHIKGSDKS
jgi:zinc/manganese transport system substrate-binding protein